MADQTVNNEVAPPKPNVHPDVATPAAQNDANAGASAKGLAEVQGLPPTAATPTADGKPAGTDAHADTGATIDANPGVVQAALSAWDSSAKDFGNWMDSSATALSKDFPDIASIFDSTTATPVSLTDAASPVGAKPGAGTDAVPAASSTPGAPTPLEGQAANPAPSSAPADQVAITHNGQIDTATENGQTYSRNDQSKAISDNGPDGTSTITHEGVDNHFAGTHFHREFHGPAADPSQLQPGEVSQGSNGVSYKSTDYTDKNGGGTVTAGTDGSLTIQGNDGNKLVLDPNQRDVDWTPAGGKTEHMTYQQFEKEYGKKDFAGFHIDGNGQVTNRHDNVLIQAHEQNGTAPGTASIAKTNPNGGDVATATVSSNGTSELRHNDANGGFLSDSKINYNNAAEAYQQFGQNGQLLANYNLNNDTFQGQGFAFNDSGMSSGGLSYNDDGTITASDSSYTDPTQTAYTGDGSLYNDLSLSGTPPTGISTDVQADIASQLPDLSSMSADQIATLDQMAGGKLNLDGALDHAESRETRQAFRQERQDRLASSNGIDGDVLDFAAAKDPYKQADIYAA